MTPPGDVLQPDSTCVHALAPSPNHGERRGNAPIDMVILHYTGMPEGDQALNWLCNPVSDVSCHYFIHDDGRVLQLVAEARRAWHAGVAFWAGAEDINSRSIGIEIVNPGPPEGPPDFPDGQIEAVIALCGDIIARTDIPPARILAHSDIAPGRKSDPGGKFPWGRLAAAGIGHFVAPEPIGGGLFMQRGDEGQPVQALQAMLAHYGYGVDITGVFDEKTGDVVTAFQRHFRPERVDGIADQSTLTTLYTLSKTRPDLAVPT